MYEWKPAEPMTPEQIAREQAKHAAHDALIASARKRRRMLGWLLIVVGLACMGIGIANLLTGAPLSFASFVPVIGGVVALVAGLDQQRRS
jgi:hypothetical protein